MSRPFVPLNLETREHRNPTDSVDILARGLRHMRYGPLSSPTRKSSPQRSSPTGGGEIFPCYLQAFSQSQSLAGHASCLIGYISRWSQPSFRAYTHTSAVASFSAMDISTYLLNLVLNC